MMNDSTPHRLVRAPQAALKPSLSLDALPAPPEFSWEQALRTLQKNRRLALLIAGSFFALASLAAVLLKNVYQPVARLEIAPPTSGIKTLHEIESTTEAENVDYLETQAQILRSDAIAVSVIRELGLASNSAFSGSSAPPPPSASQASLNPSLLGDNPYLVEQLSLATLTPAEARALDIFRKGLTVSPIRNTRLIEISYASHDPQIARNITNTVVARYIDSSYKQRYNTTMQASEWLSSQLSDLRRKVESSNRAVSDYQKKYGLVELDDRDVPMSQLMNEINHELSVAQASRIEGEAYVRMLDTGQTESIPLLRDDQVYQTLLVRSAELRAQLAQAQAIYGDANPNIKKLDDQIHEMNDQIDAERNRVVQRIRAGYEASREREKLMLQSREKLRDQMGSVSSQLVGYHILKSEAMANADLYNTLQARLHEAGIYAGLRSGHIRVVDLAANLQKPTGPHRIVLSAFGLLFGCFVAIAACFVKESFNNTVRTPDDVRSWIGLRSLALLPEIKRGSAALPASASTSPILSANGNSASSRFVTILPAATAGAEAMRDLRTSLLNASAGAAPSVFLISSSMEGEGKTTVAVNFAVALAQLGRTCLVDADLRQPMVARTFDLRGKAGLSDVLNSGVSLDSVMARVSENGGLTVIPSGPVVESPVDVLASAKMTDTIAELKSQFDYVVIDTPPVIRFSDARFLSRLADEVVLVGRYGITTRRAMQRSAELLKDAQAPVAGVVLNGIDLSSPDYHYFTYGYARGYSHRDPIAEPVRFSGPGDSDNDTPARSKGAHA